MAKLYTVFLDMDDFKYSVHVKMDTAAHPTSLEFSGLVQIEGTKALYAANLEEAGTDEEIAQWKAATHEQRLKLIEDSKMPWASVDLIIAGKVEDASGLYDNLACTTYGGLSELNN